MANSPLVYDAACEAMINAFCTLLNGGSIVIYTGSQPATDGSLTGTLLATILFSATAFAAALASGSGGQALANAITSGTAPNTGNAGYHALLKSDGTTVVGTGSVGTAGADLNMNTVAIVAGTIVSCSAYAVTQPQT